MRKFFTEILTKTLVIYDVRNDAVGPQKVFLFDGVFPHIGCL